MQKQMKYRVLIPVKTLHHAKSRLALYLNEEERAALVLAMLHHVISTLLDSAKFERVAVVSADKRVLEQVQHWGATALLEERQGHNPALEAAAQAELATGPVTLLTISADLPLLQVQDVCNMLEQAQQYDVVLVPSLDGTGTNALLTRPPLALPYLFGPGSLQHYSMEAKRRALNFALYHSLGFALDIDTIDDLEMFRRYEKEYKAARTT